ncbi:hypothetical protein AB2B41_04440 [Marimonas sp. MJW-29]|uniref:Tetratricopeptide repeat protein n=1 Tax=Sulfitobacter sediminis TaxID=3234186 RepID=A0ABV3RIP3_9RHOB
MLGKDTEIVTADSSTVRVNRTKLNSGFGAPGDGEFLEGLDLKSEPFDDWRREAGASLERSCDSESDAKSVETSGHEIFRNPSILVMAFVSAGQNEEDNAFATGLVIDLRTSLSMWRQFPVIGPEAIGWHTERDGNLREIAETVNAAYAISGAIRRSGERIRVTASMSETATGYLVWTETFDGQMSDVFEMQENMGRAVVARIFPEIAKSEAARITRQNPSDVASWQLMAKVDEIERVGGEGYGTPESNRAQLVLLEDAVTRQPDYARAWARLGRYWFRSALQGWLEDRSDGFEKALEFTQKAVTLDPLDWEGHSYRALTLIFGNHSFGPGRFHAQEAVRLNPSAPLARHALGCALEWLGEIDEAIRQKEVLFALNPNYPARAAVLGELSTCLLFQGKMELAAETARNLRDLAPDYSRGLQRVASVLGHVGAKEEAADALERVMRLQPDFGENYVRETYPYSDTEHLETLIRGLRLAGMQG